MLRILRAVTLKNGLSELYLQEICIKVKDKDRK